MHADARTPRVSVQADDFDLQREIDALHGADARVGAICSFVGTVRDRNDDDAVASMELEHYPGMTEKSIEAMIDEAHRRFDIFGARVIHRVGRLEPLDQVLCEETATVADGSELAFFPPVTGG